MRILKEEKRPTLSKMKKTEQQETLFPPSSALPQKGG
jgi:hypothetical protein